MATAISFQGESLRNDKNRCVFHGGVTFAHSVLLSDVDRWIAMIECHTHTHTHTHTQIRGPDTIGVVVNRAVTDSFADHEQFPGDPDVAVLDKHDGVVARFQLIVSIRDADKPLSLNRCDESVAESEGTQW